ncbi:hypothetical protein [Novispirillum itersonii]|uniref:5-hydroxyisourate hydrolase-like protein (Transthyretin family) n=1 Tax=Novispirillum itersonii TaxID=189 RepID=A0A7W9ZJX4_NOVIT|nr:hypothetical protein [Novispirillum itersonii]MBB6211554.1 5-hydroxyisourate hydrolase-like protein (transthyretin family) [Novispirillum itersonii]
MRFQSGLFAAALLAAAAAAPSAHAGSWKFELTNKTKEAITEFRTKEDGQWSNNWLSEAVKAGDVFEMDFGTAEGDCVVRTQVIFADKSYFDYDVDYCKVNKLDVYNNEIKLR